VCATASSCRRGLHCGLLLRCLRRMGERLQASHRQQLPVPTNPSFPLVFLRAALPGTCTSMYQISLPGSVRLSPDSLQTASGISRPQSPVSSQPQHHRDSPEPHQQREFELSFHAAAHRAQGCESFTLTDLIPGAAPSTVLARSTAPVPHFLRCRPASSPGKALPLARTEFARLRLT